MSKSVSENADGGKRRFQLHLAPSTISIIDEIYKSDNCRSRSEFIEKAVLFYAEYLTAQKSKAFLPGMIVSTMQSILADSNSKQNRLLFKLAVEIAMLENIVAAGKGISQDSLERLRGECVAEVKRINGAFSFDEAAEWQRKDD